MAAGGAMQVTYVEMEDAAKRLANDEEAMNEILNHLQSYIEGLVGSGFVTERASESFNSAFQQFKRDTSSGLEALTAMGTYLREAQRRLKETDEGLVVSYQ